MGKRLFDVVAATLGLLVLSPVFLMISLAVKLSGPGPVFFRQERIGRRFQPFTILKFRSMRPGSEGPPLTVRGDERITAVGRLLRRTKLDELPQLWNVLKGEMSLVGPRPEVRSYVEMFRNDYEEILTLRPGITDQASVEFRDEEVRLAQSADPDALYRSEILPRKIRLAKDYVRTRNGWSDFLLLLRTVLHL
ncbi:MAG: sugar transferase [Candidatus Zixiibacteriota bacterium]